MKKRVLVLGCTGSIGSSTISIIRDFPHLFSVCGLTAHSNKALLESLAKEFNCNYVLTSTENNLESFINSCNADICVNGISGSAGLYPTVLCLKAGIDVALANKETIVMASEIVMSIAKENNCKIIPVDSEHSAIFSLINKHGREHVSKIILTASGGPFKNCSLQDLYSVTPQQALKHPTWDMGKKISIDSATLANKGLEVIEACRLFNVETEHVAVTIHPQSLVHSLIETIDGDLYAQISTPDMRRPILSALTYPTPIENSLEKFSFSNNIEMSFSPPNNECFPLLSLAFESQKKKGSYTIAYNAANEIAVSLFLEEKLTFMGIPALVSSVLALDWSKEVKTIDEVLNVDAIVRDKTIEIFKDKDFDSFKIKKDIK